MSIGAIAIIVVLAWIVLFEYSCMVVSKRADEQAEKMEQKLKERKHGTDE